MEYSSIEDIRNNSKMQNLVIISFAVYVFALYVFSNNIATIRYANIPLAVFIFLSGVQFLLSGKVFMNYAIIQVFFFAFFCVLSFIWAIDIQYASTRIFTVVQLFVLVFLSYQVFHNIKGSYALLDILFYAGIGLCVYSVVVYTPSGILETITTSERLGALIGNENLVARNFAVTAVVGFHYMITRRNLLSIILTPLSVILILATKSRSGISLMVVGFLILLYYSFGKKYKLRFVILLSLIALIVNFLGQQEWLSQVSSRVKAVSESLITGSVSDASTKFRFQLLRHGWESFKEHPAVGFGVGASYVLTMGTYYHNNYIQLLVECGLLGFLLYYSIHIYLLRGLLAKLKEDSVAIVLFSLVILSLIYDFSTSSYYDKLTYVFFSMSATVLSTNNVRTTYHKCR